MKNEIANNSIVLHAKHVLAISHKTNDHYIAYKSTRKKKHIPRRQAKSKKYTRKGTKKKKKKCVKRVAKVALESCVECSVCVCNTAYMWVGDV